MRVTLVIDFCTNFTTELKARAAPRFDSVGLTNLDVTIWSYGEFHHMAARMNAVLINSGVTPDDRVLVQVHKSASAGVLYLACLRAASMHLPIFAPAPYMEILGQRRWSCAGEWPHNFTAY